MMIWTLQKKETINRESVSFWHWQKNKIRTNYIKADIKNTLQNNDHILCDDGCEKIDL